MFFSIDHVQVAFPSGHETEADAFYVDILGFVSIAKPPSLAARGGRWYESGVTQLHLGADPSFAPSAKAHVALRCSDYDNVRERLIERGARVQDDDEIAGVTRLYTWDPFGNRLEVIAT